MDRSRKVTLTNMCMVYDDFKNILVQCRRKKDYLGYTFPGGHVEKDESLTDAVIREVYEETGLRIYNPVLCGVKDWVNDDESRYIVFLYKTNKFEGEIKSSSEGEISWVSLNDFKNLNLAQDMDTLINVFLDNNLTEQFFYKKDGRWIQEIK